MGSKMIDTHTHLCDPVFSSDRALVLAKAREAGVSHVISVSETLADVELNLKLAEVHADLCPAAGLYPANLDLDEAQRTISLIEADPGRFIAIGEVGLDHWVVKEEAERALQREIFLSFIDLSLETELPLNIHSRSAGKVVVDLLLKKGAKRVQLHAFDGKASSALPAVEAGYFFSVPTSLLRSRQKQKLVKRLPLSVMLLETDSPVLGVDPDTRNEPANLPLVVDAIAEIKGEDPAAVREIVTANTYRLYEPLLDTDNF